MTYEEQDRAFWDELKGLARDNKVKEFYIKYAEYLKWAGIYSESRMCLYKMALAVGKVEFE